MKKNNLFIALALFINSIAFSQKSDQFGLDSINKKLIDNKGKGFDSLIGCRNVRVVLKNLVYRGGNILINHRKMGGRRIDEYHSA